MEADVGTELFCDFEIDENFGNVWPVLLRIRPNWNKENVKLQHLNGGITNKIVGFYHENDVSWSDMILIRRYGENTQLVIDRKAEHRNMKLLHSLGCGSPLFASMRNGVVYGFVPGCTVHEDQVTDSHIVALVAMEMAKIHSVDLSQYGDFDCANPCLYTKLSSFFNGVPKRFSNAQKQKAWEAYGCSVDQLHAETQLLKRITETKTASPKSFCHNDILLGNIVYNSDSDKVFFIDFEYGDYNYTYFDIANHFNEYAGVQVIDYSRYPQRAEQKHWLAIYFKTLCKLQGNLSGLSSLTDSMLDQVCDEIGVFSLNSHLFWGVWALVQAEFSQIDFDYVDYAITRFNRYFQTKEKFLAPFLS